MALISSKEAGMAYPHKINKDGVVTEKNPNADQAAGEPVEQEAVTGRPNDLVAGKVSNTTLGDRAKAGAPAPSKGKKAVTEAEDKSVKGKATSAKRA